MKDLRFINMKTFNITGITALLLLMFIISCHKDKPIPPVVSNVPTPYTITVPQGFPTKLNIPADNPMTVEGIKLGRYLYYDGRICGKQDTLMSCGTCHQQAHAFVNGIGYAHGTTGVETGHIMLPHTNLVFNSTGYTWAGEVEPQNPAYTGPGAYGGNLEDVVYLVIVLEAECHSDTNKSKAAIQNIPIYPPMFKAAFGSETVTFKNIAKAISQFVRTLISADSKFDKYLRGETSLTSQEIAGYGIFNSEVGDCYHCHGTILFTTNGYYNNAKDTVFTDSDDRYSVTHNPQDHGAYKAPTLRNIAVSGGPYMHDGRFATLDDVINFYSSGLVWSPYVSPMMYKISQGGAQLVPSQKAALKAFLYTLTDSSFITNPAFSKPAGLP